MVKRALISVSKKDGVVGFAKGLAKLGYEIISTGGTAKALEAAGVRWCPRECRSGWARRTCAAMSWIP